MPLETEFETINKEAVSIQVKDREFAEFAHRHRNTIRSLTGMVPIICKGSDPLY